MPFVHSRGEVFEPLLRDSSRTFEEINNLMCEKVIPNLLSLSGSKYYIIYPNGKPSLFEVDQSAHFIKNERFYVCVLAKKVGINIFELGNWLDKCIRSTDERNINLEYKFVPSSDSLLRFDGRKLLYLPPKKIIPARYIEILDNV